MVLREAVGDLNRMGKILQVVVKHGFGDLLGRAKIFERLGIRKPEAPGDTSHSPAQRLARMLCELGPIFIKMGQILSTRPDIVPAEYIEALRKLQDNAPPITGAQVTETIEQELGQPPERLFARFDTQPIASASIAQVHRATTHAGDEVVVKIKRPGIERTVRSDLDILYSLAHLLESVFEDTNLYEPVAVVREFDRAIGLEMNLEREAENLRTFGKNFTDRDNLVIPALVDALCSRSVLTMSYLDGAHLDQMQPGDETSKQAALSLIAGFYQQVFEDGFFHTDPHPGNLRFLPDGKVGLMDFGQVGRLSATMRNTIVLFGLGVILREPDTVARLVYRIGSQSKRVDLGALKEDIQKMLQGSLEKKLGEINTGQLLNRLLDLSQRHQVRLPADYVLLAKAMATVDGILRVLDPQLDPSQVAAPYVKRMLAERFSLEDVRGGLGRGLLQLSGFLNEVPQQVSQILLDLEGGRMTINVRDPEVTLLRKSVRSMGIDLFWGLIAAGLVVGSMFGLMAPGETPLAAVLGLIGAGLIAAIGTLRYYLGPLLGRMRLRPWLERRWGEDDPDCKPK
jgi:ubiquinone biosynthesis protein